MSNKTYCMFQNTVSDLYDCEDRLFDNPELSEFEYKALQNMIPLCQSIIDNADRAVMIDDN